MTTVTDHIHGIAETLSECLSRVEQEARSIDNTSAGQSTPIMKFAR